ncbi:MAG: hypothetical protein U0263_38420 [Polyangiaceae bacterium]
MDPRRLLGLAVGGAVAFACGSEDAAEKSKTLNKPDASLIDSPADVAHDHPGDAASDTDATLPYDGPAKLSETGLYSDMAQKKLAAEIRPYDVREPEWLDGTTSKRYILLPAGEKIDTSFMEVWKFPVGTKAWREISVQGTPVETRFCGSARGRRGLAPGFLRVELGGRMTLRGARRLDGGGARDPEQRSLHSVPQRPGRRLDRFCRDPIEQADGGGYLSTLISEGSLTDPPPGSSPCTRRRQRGEPADLHARQLRALPQRSVLAGEDARVTPQAPDLPDDHGPDRALQDDHQRGDGSQHRRQDAVVPCRASPRTASCIYAG